MTNFSSNVSVSVLLWYFAIEYLTSNFIVFDSLITYFALGALVVPPLLLGIVRTSELCKFDLSTLVRLKTSLHRFLLVSWIEKVMLWGSTRKSCLLDQLFFILIKFSCSNFLLIFLIIWNIWMFAVVKLIIDKLSKSCWF